MTRRLQNRSNEAKPKLEVAGGRRGVQAIRGLHVAGVTVPDSCNGCDCFADSEGELPTWHCTASICDDDADGGWPSDDASSRDDAGAAE